ncbi:unnamed protein product [Schistosoma margrebowiei]|uniref:Uncharacterized protein n=1 Tax=Schistosoma margrebowiei TaxID=48269 RepID=A0A183M2U5_9TREM|nr:unnamed protein product [Schistosoma margrebowiei]
MKTSTSRGKLDIQWTTRMQLDNLDFADDLALLLHNQQQIQRKIISVSAASAAVGLNIHKGKRQILRHNIACTNPITLDREDLEDVKSFTYLGSIIDEYSGSDADVKAWISKARAANLQLKNIWNSRQLSTNTKLSMQNNSGLLAKHYQQQPAMGENSLDSSGERNREEALEFDRKHIEESIQLHHKASCHMRRGRPKNTLRREM